MAQHHRIRIRLRGCNEFVEKFPGGSPQAAKDLARSRYPEAQYISWQGSARSDAEEAAAAARVAEREAAYKESYRKQHGWVEGGRTIPTPNVTHSSSTSSSSNNNSSSDSSGAGAVGMLLVGGVALYFVLLVAPIIAGVGSAKLADGMLHQRRWYTRLAGLLLVGSMSFGGTVALQQEFMGSSPFLPSETTEEVSR